MEQLDLLRLVVETLEKLEVRYAIVGSFASGAWGEPRLTHDIDIVVELDNFDAQILVDAFSSDDFYVSSTAAHEAVASAGQFNLLHPASGNKVDFMIVGDTGWANAQLSRCLDAPLLPDRTVRVARAEDVILGKLLYYQDGGSEKHVRDISGILATQVVDLDRDYLNRVTQELGVAEEWQSILDRLAERNL